jgi:dTMP kinase
MNGLFITFEGTEGCGKSTQVRRLADRLTAQGRPPMVLREPGGTPLGEEIRHLLKHHPSNAGMNAEAELLLMNASRAQLVREIIRPALDAGQIVLCDRFADSTLAYQGYGRGLNLDVVRRVLELAVGTTRPDLTFLLSVPVSVSEARRAARARAEAGPRDRFEENDRGFFERVERGYRELSAAEPDRIKVIDSQQSVEQVGDAIWAWVQPRLRDGNCGGARPSPAAVS